MASYVCASYTGGNMSVRENRGKPRFHIDQMIEFSLDGETQFRAKLTNISESGVQVSTDTEPEAQAPVELIIGIETGDDRTQIAVEGIIIWVKKTAKGYASGIQFMDIREDQRRLIGSLTSKNDS